MMISKNKLILNKIIFSFAFLGIGILNASEANAKVENIPGIDILEQAVDPNPIGLPIEKINLANEIKKFDKRKSINGSKPDESLTDPKISLVPIITNLKAARYAEKNNSIILTWDLPSDNKFPIYVGRTQTQVVNKESVLNSDNLTAPPLSAQQKTYVDYNIPDGTYYYVVVTQGELRKDGVLVLKADQNFTSKPIRISRNSDMPQIKEPEEKIAINDQDKTLPLIKKINVVENVKIKGEAVISWDYTGKEDTIVYIARNIRPIKSEKILRNSQRINGSGIKSSINYFVDSDVPEGAHYYAVFTQKEMREKLSLEEYENYTSDPFVKSIPKKSDDQPEEKPKEPEEKKEATPPVKDDASQPEFKNPRVAFFSGKTVVNNVELTWDVDKRNIKDCTLQLFRSEKQIRNINEVEERGILIGEFPDSGGSYIDKDLSPGKFYYALVHTKGGNKIKEMIEGKNFLKNPLWIKDLDETKESKNVEEGKPEETPIHSDEATSRKEIDNIIAKFYNKGKFGEAIRRLAPFVSDKKLSDPLRARSMLYTGMSYHNLGQHSSAIEFFLTSRVKQYYPERSEFWYKRSLEKLK